MKHIIKCELNIDTASVEDEIASTPAQRAELDWLIYNEPLTYAAMVLSGTESTYLCGPFLHNLDD